MKLNPVIVKEVSQEILEWLENKCSDGYSIQPHIVPVLWAGPLLNLSTDQKFMAQKVGQEIWFDDEQMAVEFKSKFDM